MRLLFHLSPSADFLSQARHTRSDPVHLRGRCPTARPTSSSGRSRPSRSGCFLECNRGSLRREGKCRSHNLGSLERRRAGSSPVEVSFLPPTLLTVFSILLRKS